MTETQTDVLKINTESWVEDLTKEKEKSKLEQVKLFTLVDETDPILLEVMPEFDFNNPPVNPNHFASSLVETCKFYNGLGLSANQCGFRYRVFVMGMKDEYVAFFNPRIVNQSSESIHMAEGCLSFPDLFINITRPNVITVEYEDYTGTTKKAVFSGLTARCFQHELDHMNGILFTKKAKPLALKMAIKSRIKTQNNRIKHEKRLKDLKKI